MRSRGDYTVSQVNSAALRVIADLLKTTLEHALLHLFEEQAAQEECIKASVMTHVASVSNWKEVFQVREARDTTAIDLHKEKDEDYPVGLTIKHPPVISSKFLNLAVSHAGQICTSTFQGSKRKLSFFMETEEVSNVAKMWRDIHTLESWTNQFRNEMNHHTDRTIAQICALSISWRACLRDVNPNLNVMAYKQGPRASFGPMSEDLVRALQVAAPLLSAERAERQAN